ncbi:MAG: amino acid ABC transporter substrate-binding protein [Candidatus Eremiobacteraeota bacterium]|nr:amino acid ABC transporter substrate-binding protein [Candidatus Eremiobacteraeota bacterium]MBV8355028.1 amino acid ABC transporter substrate-binding protein [Candidatus Eremiobacteraeota bacterium]
MKIRFLAVVLGCAFGAAALIPAAVSVRAAGDVIQFGAAVSLTGSLAKEGHLTQEGYDFWKDYANAHGGIKVAGKPYKVDIKYYDDESNPQTAARLIEKLVDQDHVNFILGPYGSGSSFSAAAVAERKKVPMVEGNGAAEKIFNQNYRYTFGVLSPAKRYLEGIIAMGKAEKPAIKTMAISASNDSFSVEVQAGAVDYAKAHGIDVVYSAKYPENSTDVSAIVSPIKAAHPDLILNAGHTNDALLVHKGLKEQNVQALAYGYSVGPDTPDFRTALGRDADYVFGGAQWSDAVRYKGQAGFYQTAPAYAEAFIKRYNHKPDYHNAESTAACLAYQYAIEQAGSLDTEKVRDALAKLDVTTFFGIIKFDSRGLNVFKPMVINQIQNDNLVTVWPSGLAQARVMWPTPVWAKR